MENINPYINAISNTYINVNEKPHNNVFVNINSNKFIEIPKDQEELEKLYNKPLLVTAKNWEHADIAMIDEFNHWYSPVDGSDCYPNPTHYMEIPKL